MNSSCSKLHFGTFHEGIACSVSEIQLRETVKLLTQKIAKSAIIVLIRLRIFPYTQNSSWNIAEEETPQTITVFLFTIITPLLNNVETF